MFRILIFLFMLSACVIRLQAQPDLTRTSSTSKTNISCFVVSPIGIMKIRDMRFGNIISGNIGTVVLSPEGENTSITGDVALIDKTSTFSAASFEVTDGVNASKTKQRFYSGYTITLPSHEVVLVNESGESMRVSNFTSYSSGYSNFKDGVGELSIGATLYVSSRQGLGNYVSSAPFPVTVNFY